MVDYALLSLIVSHGFFATNTNVEQLTTGRFLRTYWYEEGIEHGNPSLTSRFRVNAPETSLHPSFMHRSEARGNGMMQIRIDEDLAQLDAAYLYLEIWGGHPGTANKRVSINGRSTYSLPEVGTEEGHCTHMYPVLPLKITDLVNGYNAIQLACDRGSTFWGHFIVESACLMLTFKPDHPLLQESGIRTFGAFVTIQQSPGDAELIHLGLEIMGDNLGSIVSVDFRGCYDGYDENGNLATLDWHGFTKTREPAAFLGQATRPPFGIDWDLSMLSEQQDMKVQAFVRFRDLPKLVYGTPVVSGLRTPESRAARVSRHPAMDLPVPFWSRADRKPTCTIPVDTDPARIERAELHVVAWDGGSGGVDVPFTLNGHALPVTGEGRHDVLYSRVPVDPEILVHGDNEIVLHSDTEHHGIEILRPGPELFVRSRVDAPSLRLRVDAAGHERQDAIAELAVDVRELLAAHGGVESLRLMELDSAGRVLDSDVLFQFDADSTDGTTGSLIWVLKGHTNADAHRYYCLSEEADRSSTSLPPLVTLIGGVMHEGQESFRITTPAATYLYHKQGAGFASMLDPDGNDWLSYHPWGGSDGKYRGIPNLVHPEGYFHPGSTNCVSEIVNAGALKVTIASQSNDGKWACQWEIYPNHARLTVTRADREYWFLYEGTPGGELDLDADYVVRSTGERTPASEKWDGDIPAPEWLYFGAGNTKRVLYLVHHEDDDCIDSYWPMEGNMTVFGFGRLGLNKYMDQVPAHFTIGFAEDGQFEAASKTINSAYQRLIVEVE